MCLFLGGIKNLDVLFVWGYTAQIWIKSQKRKDIQRPGRTIENQMAYPTDNELLAGFDEGYKDYQRSPFWWPNHTRLCCFFYKVV